MSVMSGITLLLHSGDNHLLFLLESNGSCGKRKFKGLNWQHMLSDERSRVRNSSLHINTANPPPLSLLPRHPLSSRSRHGDTEDAW